MPSPAELIARSVACSTLSREILAASAEVTQRILGVQQCIRLCRCGDQSVELHGIFAAGGRATLVFGERRPVEHELLDARAASCRLQRERCPEETPQRLADPPVSPISARRSSISRSAAYGCVSPLLPRPHRS